MNQKKQIKPFHIIGVSVATANANRQAMADIGRIWDRFYSENIRAKIPAKVDKDIYAIYTDYESDYQGKYTFILGCKVATLENIPEGFIGQTVEGGTYLKYTAKGKMPEAVANQWGKIWKSDDKLARLYTTDFEVYGAKSQNPENAEVDIYIATR